MNRNAYTVSATPFNNIPNDTFSLIKLFQIPTRSTLLTITNLSELFEHLTKKHNALVAEQRKNAHLIQKAISDSNTISNIGCIISLETAG